MVFLIGSMVTGCTPREKKETGKTSDITATPKNFERVKPPVLLTDPQAQAGYMITHYWDYFNFRDTMYCHVPDITVQAFVDFIVLFPYVSSDIIDKGVKKLLDSAEVDEVMYNYFCILAESHLYDPNSPYRNDEYYIPFLEHNVASLKLNEASKVRPQHVLQLVYRNRPGAKAENVVYTTASGTTGQLYNLSARNILLMFYNPDCKECKQTTAEIKQSAAITAAISSGRLKVLAVYPDENLDIWRSHLNEMPSSWINGYDKSLTIRNNQVYDLKAIPTLYLLDENKRVLLKDTYVELIHEFLEQN